MRKHNGRALHFKFISWQVTFAWIIRGFLAENQLLLGSRCWSRAGQEDQEGFAWPSQRSFSLLVLMCLFNCRDF